MQLAIIEYTMNLFRKVINTGTRGSNEKMPSIEIRILKLINIINLILIFISFVTIALIILLDPSGFKSYIRYLLLILFCILNITLNHFRLYLPAKIFTVFSPFILIFVFPIINQFIVPGMLIWFPYGIIIIGALSFFIFTYEKERHLLNYTLLFFFLAVIFYDKILLHAIPNTLDLSFIYKDNYLYYLASKIMLAFFFYFSFYLAKITTYKNRQELKNLNKILDQKNNELNYLNQNLEKAVKDRTKKLDIQNKRIKDLAFTNAHIVRASVARIIGLINFTNDNKSDEDKEFSYKNIRESALELDEETQKISKELIEEN